MSLQIHVLFMLHKAKQNSKGLCPLVVRITYLKERRQLATGYSLIPSQWERLQQSARLRDDKLKQVAQFMETMKTKLYQIANTLELENRMDLETLIDLYLNKPKNNMSLLVLFRMHNEELDKRTTLDRAKATHSKYRYTYDKLQQFIHYQFNKPDILISKLEPSFIQLFYDYLLLQCRIAHNTIAKYCKNLKRIINYGKEKGLIKENPFEHFQIGYKDIDRSYLTASELQLIEQKHIPIKRLEVVRDLFLFQCYTGLSFIDMAQLGKGNIIEGIDKKPWIYSCRHKTKVKYTVPLLSQALQVIEKYKNNMNDGRNLVLPVMSNQKFNAYLKEIATICGIDKELSSHIGRRTFATTVALSNGIPMESIAKMLGHTNSKITSIYAVVTDIKLSKEMEEVERKLSFK